MGLLPHVRSTPHLHQLIVRVGTWLPFEQVPEALTFLCGASVSSSAARRITEHAGAHVVAAETAEADRLERETPPSPAGPAVQQVSADGAMVPLLGGEWAEVRTVAIGTIEQVMTTAGPKKGTVQPKARHLAYFSRLTDAETFGHLATIATYRQGTERAGTVCAVADGAEWLQGFFALHCPHAVRILDWCHAMEYLGAVATATWGVGRAEAKDWLDQQKTTLLTTTAQEVLTVLRALVLTGEAAKVRDKALHYLEQREAQIAYARFRERGYPIGSGIVESANKLVVEDRLKRSGMRWSREQVNPMLALRCSAASGQWHTGWVTIWERTHQMTRTAREEQWRRCQAAARPVVPPPAPPPQRLGILDGPPTMVDGKPTPYHPWN